MKKRVCVLLAIGIMCCTVIGAAARTNRPTTSTTVTTTFSEQTTTTLSDQTSAAGGVTGTTVSEETGTISGETVTTTTAPPLPTDPVIPHLALLDKNGEAAEALQWEGKKGKNPVKLMWEETERGQAVRFEGETTNLLLDMKDRNVPFTLSLWVNWQPNPDIKIDQRLFTFLQKGTEYQIGVSPWLQRSGENGETINGIGMEDRCLLADEWRRATHYYPASENMNNALSANMWHHISLTVEQKTICLYIDSVLWKKVELPYTYETLGVDTLILGGGDNNIFLFQGLMQDCRLYEGALNATQIGRLYQQKSPFEATITVPTPSYTHVTMPEGVIYDKVYELKTVLENKKPVIRFVGDSAPAFWENPTIGMGQTVSGTMTLKNTSKQMVHLFLQSISLPAQTSEEWKYLSEVQVTISGAVYYDGAFTDLSPEKLQLNYPYMREGETQRIQITLSRPLNSRVAVCTADTPWKIEFSLPRASNALPKVGTGFWILLLIGAGLVLLGFSVYWTVTRRLPQSLIKLFKKR